MMPINHRGTFHAVGQGLFHSAQIDFGGRASCFRYVYDCGTDGSPDELAVAVDGYVSGCSPARLNLLMVSHLDADHVSGLPGLLEGLRKTGSGVDDALLPYLHPEERAIVAAWASRGRKRPAAWYFEFLDDPAGFLLEHGVRRVIYIRGGDGPPPEGGVGGPSEGIDVGGEAPHDHPGHRPDKPLELVVNLGLLDAAARDQAADRERRSGHAARAGIDFRTSRGSINVGEWVFIFFNREPAQAKLAAFRAEFDKIAGDLSPKQVLAEPEKTARVKIAYDRVFGRRRINETSLGVFSGCRRPSEWHSPRGVVARWAFASALWPPMLREASRLLPLPSLPIPSIPHATMIGILFTGDLTLDMKVWPGFAAKYGVAPGSERTVLAAFQIPHHGAATSWRKALAEMPCIDYVASAAIEHRLKHPSRPVIADVLNRGRRLHWANEKREVEYELAILE
ncbi:MAG: hypothetical protein HY905_21810 [Deltaproteobacteria bacterium]|nr:hypothetical protein [Deltaproteobacteria bacterium]